jgi:carbamoyl-phosphate synthase small subunit
LTNALAALPKEGGQMDSAYLFDMYLENVQRYKKNQAIFLSTKDSRPSQLLVDILSKERVGVAPMQAAESFAQPVVATAASV